MVIGYLTRPSQDLINVAKILESVFDEGFGTQTGIVKKLFNTVNNKIPKDCIPPEVIECLIRTRLYIRLRELNKKEQKKTVFYNNKKIKKFTE